MTDTVPLEAILRDAVIEAKQHRFGAEELGPEAIYTEVLDALVDLRKRYDRIEEIYLRVLQIRSRVILARNQRQNEATDAWNAALMRIKQSPSRTGDEYTGPRERYAEADLSTLDQKLKSRQAEAVAESANTALDCLKTILRGIDGSLQDHRIWLRSLNFQSNLEA